MKHYIAKVLSLVFLCYAINGAAQIQAPATPQFQSFDNRPIANTDSHPNGGVINETSKGLLPQQQNAQVSLQKIKEQEIAQLIKEVQKSNTQLKPVTENRNTQESLNKIGSFEKALHHLEGMLTGKSTLSLAEAYYTIESAYGGLHLSKSEYHNTIQQSIAFIKAWMTENKLDIHDNYMVHYAIQKFMSESLTIHKKVNQNDKEIKLTSFTHQPFLYDYNDYAGAKDYRNSFLTKCLATGFGQCSSMPALYLVLAEGMGVKAYLSIAPHHSFIKYPDNRGYIVNYEPTTHWEISDKWYKDNLFITAKASETGIYLDTLNTKQIVANCIFDLAVAYAVSDKSGQDDFILKCIKSGVSYFPKNNNLQALFLKSMCLKTALWKEMKKGNITSFDDIDKLPLAKKYYADYLATEAWIAALGYQDLPNGMYEELLNQQDFKRKIQDYQKFNTKQKRNLFSKID